MGELQLISGPMMAGKTTELLKRISRYAAIGKKCLYVNSMKDTRGINYSTHNPLYKDILENENITFCTLAYLDHGYMYYELFDVIAIDEGQFFPYLDDVVKNLVEEQNKIVIASGLDLDFERKPFGKIGNLYPFADKVTRLFSFCSECSKQGKLTNALFSHKYTENSEQEDVGGAEKYQPLCRECFVKNN